jgi:hypothetical protein
MNRLYTIVEPFRAKSPDGEFHEFKTGELLWCDLQQNGAEFKFESGDHLEWLVDRDTFERHCVSARPTGSSLN